MPKLKFSIPEPKIGVSHPDFGTGRPPTPELIEPTTMAYAQYYENKLKKRASKPLEFYQNRLPLVREKYRKLAAFERYFVESDIAELSTLCDIGDRAFTHSQADEGRTIGSTFSIKFDEEVVKQVLDIWTPLIKRARLSDVSVKVPSNTSLGWPYLFADTEEKPRAFMLAVMAAAIHRSKLDGMTLRDAHSIQEQTYGPRFLVPGTRQQHTSKPMPLLHGMGNDFSITWTQNFEGRTRYIAMGGKLAMLWNKYDSKLIVNAALLSDQHIQDRPILEKTIVKWAARPNWETVAMDASGFDGAIGGNNLKEVLRWISVLVGRSTHEDLLDEVSAPMLVPFLAKSYLTTTPITPQLPSGVSFTTACALLMGDYIALKFCKDAGLTYGKDFFYKNWGDDFILHFPSSVNFEEVVKSVSVNTNIKFDREPTVKYLGFNYANGEYETRLGYSVGRLLIKSILPERKSFYPFSLIGYLARLHFIPGDKERFHQLALNTIWDETLMGPKFIYADRDARLKKALTDAQKATLVDTDVIQFLVHGFDGDSLEASVSEDLDIDFDFSQWIGNAFIDLTDPIKAMREHSPELFNQNRVLAKRAAEVGLLAVAEIADVLKNRYNFRQAGSYGPFF